MTIKKALKEKNKKIKKIGDFYSKMTQYNSIEEGKPRPYSSKEMMEKYKESVNELIELKTKIHLANAPVYDKIFRLSELKSMVKNINSMNCSEGSTQYNRFSEERVIMTSEISIIEKDLIIEEMENEIEKIQDELDHFNTITNI
jgi:hypothetical protein